MTSVPTRDELIAKIENRYKLEVERAKSTRDDALAAIDRVDPFTLHTLALLLTPDPQPDPVIGSAMMSVARSDSSDNFDETIEGVYETAHAVQAGTYGDISRRIRLAVYSLDGEFTVHDVIAASEDPPPKPTTIAGVLKKLIAEGTVELVQQGAGKRPSSFRLTNVDGNAD